MRTLMILAVVGITTTLGTADTQDRSRDGRPRAQDRVRETFLRHYPGARFYEEHDRISRIYGTILGRGTDARSSASAFVRHGSAVLDVEPEDLLPLGPLHDRRHTQPLFYDEATNTHKFTLVYYSQHRGGLPVFRSDLRVVVRNEPGYPAVMVASNVYDLGAFQPAKSPLPRPALFHEAVRRIVPDVAQFSPLEELIWAGNDIAVAPRRAVRFIVSAAFQNWLVVADANSAEILLHEPLKVDVDVNGTVSGLATGGTGSEQCEEEVATPMPRLRVETATGEIAFTANDGSFSIADVPDGLTTVFSPLEGEYFRIINWPSGTPNSILIDEVTPPDPATFLHNEANEHLTRAEVNGYVGANVIRDYVASHVPAYPETNILQFPVYVNRTDGFCPANAWYSPGERSINFCQAAGNFPNTAFASIIYHEYGHHLVEAAGSGQGAYGEGMGDTMSVLLLDVPEIGIGYFGNCQPSSALRDADNTLISPCNGGIHFCGQVMSGAVWELRNRLIETDPDIYRDILADLTLNSILLHTGTSVSNQITVDFLTLDDDDPFIANGTPHVAQICEGFGAKNMLCPVLDPIGFEFPDGIPDVLNPNDSTLIRVKINAISAVPEPDTATITYRINGAMFETFDLDSTAPNEYDAVLPGLACGDKLEFYFSAESTDGDTLSNPPDAPDRTHTRWAAIGYSEAIQYDFELNPGFEASLIDATDGDWELAVPLAGNSAAAPSSDYDGSGRCWVTANRLGDADVDNGSVVLTSHAIDLTSIADPFITYARWFSNHSGGNGFQDTMEVDISPDGVQWVHVETIGPDTSEVYGGWYEVAVRVSDFIEPTSAVHLRFTVNDTGSFAHVEGAVDAFAISGLICTECTMPCDDGSPCTTNDTCVDGVCQGSGMTCPQSDDCHDTTCSLSGATGNCDAIAALTNQPCDDGEACTIVDTCNAGLCEGALVDCSPASQDCYTASCDPGGEDGNCSILENVPDGTDCDNQDPCNINETCQSGFCVGEGPPDCSEAGGECVNAMCHPNASEGNCAFPSDMPDGTPCADDTGSCVNGECVIDPGDNVMFMAAAGAPPAIPEDEVLLSMSPGETRTIEVWTANLDPAAVVGYQLGLPGEATRLSGSGEIGYVDTPGMGQSAVVDTAHPNWVFFGDTAQFFYAEAGLPEGFAIIATLLIGTPPVISEPGYLGQFDVHASADACGLFQLGFFDQGAPPDGGSSIVELSGQSIPLSRLPLMIEVAPSNNACANALPITGSDLAVPFDTSCSSQDGTAHACGDIGEDVWLAYTASCTGQLIVDTETDCTFDTAIAMYSPDSACVPGDDDVWACADDIDACESISHAVNVGDEVLVRVGSTTGASGQGTIAIQCAAVCNDASECGDANSDGITDDACQHHQCGPEGCSSVARVFGDAGGLFGACPPDGASSIHDRNLVLHCFEGTTVCPSINLDIGGEFDSCEPDGLCDLHDANHILSAFSGQAPCACGPAPEIPHDSGLAGATDLELHASRSILQPGADLEIDVVTSAPLKSLQSYQLHMRVTGGTQGHLELIDVVIQPRRDAALGTVAFSATNLGAGQMLAGMDEGGVRTSAGAYLATFTYRASPDAAGSFVIEPGVGGSDGRTFVVGANQREIVIQNIQPVVITVTSRTRDQE
jgi:hypothetical protein